MLRPRPPSMRSLTPLLFLALVVLLGCGGGVKPIPVQGKVTLGDNPLPAGAEGTVTFHPDTSKGNKNTFPFPPLGAIKDGKFSMATGKQEGAPAGWYKVTVNAHLPSKEEYGVPTPLVNAQFDKPETTPLSVEVKPDAAPGSYDFKVTGQ
jgi:hypothetical protein